MSKVLKRIGTINYKNGKYANVFMIVNFIFFVLIGIIVISLNNLIESNTYIILHEIIHLIFMKLFSREKINISVKFPTISVGSSAKFNKMQFIIIALAPVILLGCTLILLIVFTPKNYTFLWTILLILNFAGSKNYTFLWTILLILNFAGSGGDYMQFFKIRKYPSNTYFQDNSDETAIYQEQ